MLWQRLGRKERVQSVGKGPRKLVNGICQHECLAKFNDERRPDVDKSSIRQCRSCKQQEGSAGPALNWISCSNPTCRAWYHSARTEIGEITQKAIDAAYWLCPECAPSLKPTWVKIGDKSSDRNEVAPVTLNQLSEMMTKLVQEVVPTLVELRRSELFSSLEPFPRTGIGIGIGLTTSKNVLGSSPAPI